MATDRTSDDIEPIDASDAPDADPGLSYNATLAPSCMIWLMVIGLGVIAAIVIIWMVSNFNRV